MQPPGAVRNLILLWPKDETTCYTVSMLQRAIVYFMIMSLIYNVLYAISVLHVLVLLLLFNFSTTTERDVIHSYDHLRYMCISFHKLW